MPNNVCQVCGKKCEGQYCFSHKPRKGLTNKGTPKQRSYYKTTKKQLMKAIDEVMYDDKTSAFKKRRELFLKIWNKRPHHSQVSGTHLGSEPLSSYFHHILPKSKYPELDLVEENVILLTLDEHANVESDIYKYEEINRRRATLENKYL